MPLPPLAGRGPSPHQVCCLHAPCSGPWHGRGGGPGLLHTNPLQGRWGGPGPPPHKSSLCRVYLYLKAKAFPHMPHLPPHSHTHTPHQPSPLPLPSLAYPPYTPSHPSLKCTPPHAPGAVSAAARELRPVEIVGLYETQRVALEAELAACKAEVCGLGP